MASIRERGSNVAVLYRIGTGRDATQTSTTFTNRKDAERFKTLIDLLGVDRAIAEMQAERDVGVTLDQLAKQFLAWKERDVEARTIADYRRDYDNWISPHLGHRQAEAVDERDVQDLVDHMATRLEPKSVADRHALLGAIYRYGSAKSRQIVTHNPCLETQLPKRVKKPPKGVTLPEWRVLYAAAQEVNADAADLMLFIFATGWRFSEATALRFRDVETVDRDGRPVTYAAMRAVFRRDGENRRVLAEDEAKSRAGLRLVSLPPTVAAMVDRRQVGKGAGDFVFTNPAGNPWRQNNFLYRTWPAILKKAALDRKPTPHWLRHGHVPLLNRAGVSLPEMQRRLGHEDIAITINTYGRMIDDMSPESLDKLDALLADAPASQVVTGEVVAGVIGT